MTKVIFGRRALGVPTPLIVKAFLKWIKRVCLAASALSSVSTHENYAFILICITWFADEIEPLFGEVQLGKEEVEVPRV